MIKHIVCFKLNAGESAEKAGFGDRFKAITGEWKF